VAVLALLAQTGIQITLLALVMVALELHHQLRVLLSQGQEEGEAVLIVEGQELVAQAAAVMVHFRGLELLEQQILVAVVAVVIQVPQVWLAVLAL
jgi:hypothetical protein